MGRSPTTGAAHLGAVRRASDIQSNMGCFTEDNHDRKGIVMIAACGLDCSKCDIRKIPTDTEAANRMVAWFRQMEWLEENEGVSEVIERSMYCEGCHGDRSLHWSPDCWILKCSVDERGLQYCSQCDDFPCVRLEQWAEERPEYGEALDRLRSMDES